MAPAPLHEFLNAMSRPGKAPASPHDVHPKWWLTSVYRASRFCSGRGSRIDVCFAQAISAALESALDIAPFNLLGQRLHQGWHLFQVRIDRKRLTEGFQRPLVVADLLHDHAKAGEGAKMPGL